MNAFWKRLIIQIVSGHRSGKGKIYSNYEVAKALRPLKRNIARFLKDATLIIAVIFSASFGFKGFLLTNHLLMEALRVFHF